MDGIVPYESAYGVLTSGYGATQLSHTYVRTFPRWHLICVESPQIDDLVC